MSDCDHLFEHTGKCCKCDFDAMAQIESLQRTIEEWEGAYKLQGDYKLLYETGLAEVVNNLAGPAITPEMRERIGAHQKRLENPNTQLRQWTLAADQIFSDLLGEQG